MSGTSPLAYGGLTADQAEIGAMVASVLAKDPENTCAGADLGWFGIGLPESLGGGGGSLGDLAPVLETAGAALAATAVGWSTGVVGAVLAGFGEDAADLIGLLAAGTLPLAVPVSGGSRVTCDAGSLSGTFLALGEPAATLALPVTADGVPQLVLVELGVHEAVTARPVTGLDGTRPWLDVTLQDLPLDDTRVFAAPWVADRWRSRMAGYAALDAVGTARAALAQLLDYARTREQFGRPVGAFQAYKHRCADAFVDLKLAQSQAFRAAVTTDPRTADRYALAAGLLAPAVAKRVCGEAVQLMGGIGFTWEAGVHRNLKRSLADQVLAGDGSARALLRTYPGTGADLDAGW